DYSTRLRKRGTIMCVIVQHPKNIEDEIRDNTHCNFFFRIHSEENTRIVAGVLGYSHYARVDHIAQRLANLDFRQCIVKLPDDPNPFIVNTSDFQPFDSDLSGYMPRTDFDYTDAEE